jgi:hypothetical protein
MVQPRQNLCHRRLSKVKHANDNYLIQVQSEPFELVKTPHRKAGQSSS